MTLPPWSCAGCPTRWWGLKMAHCTACHNTFSTLRNFDKHRTGGPENRLCGFADLAEVRPGVWGKPGEPLAALEIE